jgi:hypothetical protein
VSDAPGPGTAAADPTEAGRPDTDGRPRRALDFASADLVPRWLVLGVVGATTALLCVAGVGLLLGVLGHFAAAPALLLGLVVFALVAIGVRPSLRTQPTTTARPRSATWWAIGAVGLAAVSALTNASTASQHVLHDRDPGVYVTTARWLVEEGTLEQRVPQPFLEQADLVLGSPGAMREGDSSNLDFQFSHLVPAALATVAGTAGTQAMFGFTGIVGGLVLLAFYCVAVRLTARPWAALLATAVLATSLPFFAHARDVYSEPYAMVFLWTAVVVLERAAATGSARLGALAGLLLSGCLLSRIDGLIYAVGVVAVLAWWILTATDPSTVRRLPLAVLVGAAPGAALAFADIGLRSPGYARLVRSQLAGLGAALLLAVIVLVAVVAVRSHARTAPTGAWRRVAAGLRFPPSLATVAGAAVSAGLAVLWLVPLPILEAPDRTFRGIAGWINGVYNPPSPIEFPADATFHWRSLLWLSWYVGPLLMIAAIAGAGILVRRTLQQGTRMESLLTVLFLTSGLVYLVRPSIYPDQIWATRRFVTFVLPCLALFAATTAVVLARAARGAAPALPRWLVPAGVAAALLVPTVLTTWRVRALTDQAGHLDALEGLCTAVGPDAAVLVVQARYWDLTYLQPITAWCGVPAAGLPLDAPDAEIRAMAEEWQQQGRTLHLVASTADPAGPSALDRFAQAGVTEPSTRTAMRRNDHVLAHTFGGAPSAYWSVPIAWDVAPVAPVTASG